MRRVGHGKAFAPARVGCFAAGSGTKGVATAVALADGPWGNNRALWIVLNRCLCQEGALFRGRARRCPGSRGQSPARRPRHRQVCRPHSIPRILPSWTASLRVRPPCWRPVHWWLQHPAQRLRAWLRGPASGPACRRRPQQRHRPWRWPPTGSSPKRRAQRPFPASGALRPDPPKRPNTVRAIG